MNHGIRHRHLSNEPRLVITVTHDHRMIEGFDTVYHLDDGLTNTTRADTH